MLKFIKGFGYAFSGVAYAFKTQLNFKFHVAALLLTVLAGWYFKLSVNEWLWIVVASAIVLITELINTAIEVLVDLVSPDYNPKAKIIKDVAAASVLMAAIGSAIIGLIIFIPKIF
jgi:undecaprenol kinase/diacylglycerol kinase (ATP)